MTECNRTEIRITLFRSDGGMTPLPQTPGVIVMENPSRNGVIHCAVCDSDTRVLGYA